MTATIQARNRQRAARVQARFVGAIARAVLERIAERSSGSLAVYLVATREIVELNETFLRHAGPTDVIAFDYRERQSIGGSEDAWHGEIFICVEEAIRQAERYRVAWPEEVVRCLIHGMLHLVGHDDARPAARGKMKRVENRLLKEMKWRFPWKKTALEPR